MEILCEVYLLILSIFLSRIIIFLIVVLLLIKLFVMNLETLKSIWQKICQLPKWARAIAIVLIAALVLLASLTSCGPSVRVTAKSTTDMVSIAITQDVSDSTGVNVHVNPTINVRPDPL